MLAKSPKRIHHVGGHEEDMPEKSAEQGSILVIDDEQGMLEMLEALLGLSGYRVYKASSGQGALDFLEQRTAGLPAGLPPVDLIILDILMPAMNGREVCSRIKSHPTWKYTPVLMVTALGSLQDQNEGVAIGADDYVTKPFRSEELLIRVRALLRIGRMQQSLLARNAELHALRRFNDSILQNMGDGLITADRAGRITLLNRAAAELFGIPIGDWIGKSLAALPGNYTSLVEILTNALAEKKPLRYQEISIRDGKNETIPLRVQTSFLRDAENVITGVIGIVDDLRQAKEMEARQRRLDRLEAISQMTASVAHEIRNPLVTLSLGIRYLEKNLEAQGEYQETLQRLQRQVDRLTQIVNEFLAFSRPPSLNLELCDIAQILNQAMEISDSYLAEKEIIVYREYGPVLEMKVDSEHLERVFRNLISNAVEAMPEGGKLYLRAYDCSQDFLAIQIQDTGVGMPAEVAEHVFEPFYTTKSKGTGLGLTIAQRIIEEHGGQISVQSQMSKGTTFTILLPKRR
jgi:PAS domain S-box-containing protein